MAKKQKCRGKGFGTLVLRGNTYYARWTKNGKTYVETTGTSIKKDALEILMDKTARFRLGSEEKTLINLAATIGDVQSQIAKIEEDEPSISIAHGWQAYIDQPGRPDTGANTLEVYRLQYENFSKWLTENYPDVKELRHVKDEHATAYAGYLLKKISCSTFNRHMNLLALVWRILKKSAKIKENPWDADHITRKKFIARSRRELTIEEINRVMNTATGEMQILLALGLYCGLRLGDAACLQWSSNVDMVRHVISLIPQKTERKQKRVTIPIHGTLYALLSTIPENDRRGSVLPTMQKRHEMNDALSKDVAKLFLDCDIKTSANKLTKSERAAMVEGDEPQAQKHSKGKRAAPECGYHSLRHSFVSLCAAGGVSQSVVQSLVGHGSPAMTQHYTHITAATAQAAIATLPSTGGIEAIPAATDATGAKLEGILAMLDGLTKQELKTLKKAIAKTESKRKE
jgi:integrase